MDSKLDIVFFIIVNCNFRIIEAANGNLTSARDSQYQSYSNYGNPRQNNYAPIVKRKSIKKKSNAYHDDYSRPQSSYTYGDRTEIYSLDQGSYEMPNIACKLARVEDSH